VLAREKFSKYNFDQDKINEMLADIKEIGILINPTLSNVSMTDEKDRIFYDTAKEGTALLITGNKKHFPDEPFILTPSEYIEQRELLVEPRQKHERKKQARKV